MDKNTMYNRNRVVLFYRDSPYNLQKYVIETMKQMLLQRGYRVTDISFSVEDPYSNCDKQLGQKVQDVCLVFGMDAVGFEMLTYNGQRWINTMACPCVSYLYHYANCFSSYLDMEELSWNIEFHAADGDNLKCIQEWYQESADIRLVPGFAFACREQQQWQDRDYDIYIPGDYIPSQICRQAIDKLPDVFRMIAESMIVKMEKDSSRAAHLALKQVLKDINFTCDNQEFFALLEELNIVGIYVKMKELEQVLGVCLRCGLVVAVYGSGWEQYPGENGTSLKLISIDQQKPDFETHLNIMAHTKCFIDVCCSYSESTMIHILSAMKNGAVVLSNRQAFLKDYFVDGEEILFYQAEDPCSFESLLKRYIQAEDVMMNIAGKALLKSNSYMSIEDYLELLLHIEDGLDAASELAAALI